MLIKSLLSLLLITAVAASGASAEDQSKPVPEEVVLKADRLSHEQNEDVIQAEGNVELVWGGTRLYSAIATYYRGEGLVSAGGGIKLLKDDDILTGESAKLKLVSRTGLIEKGHMFVRKNNLHLRGAEIEKIGDQDYRLQQGSITTCDGERPGWKFVVDDLKVTIDEFATGKSAFFYLGETPVFWLPYIIFPVKTERQSGFFFPKFGNSEKKGVFLDIPYYWAISASSDATFDLDLQSKRGVGMGLEYRYLSLNRGNGLTRAYLIYDTLQDRFRGDLGLKQQANFAADTYWRADVNLALDEDFYRDYGVVSGEYNKQYLETIVFLSHKRGDLIASAGVDYLNNLDVPNNKTTLQTLPFLTLMGTGARLGATPLYYSYDASAVHLERDEGARGERLGFSPRLTIGQELVAGVSGRLWAGYNQRFYHATDAGSADDWHGHGVAEGGGAVQAEFGRTFDTASGGLVKLRHLLIPELGYEFREKRSTAEIPFFDYDDRPVAGQLLTLSLHNVLTGKSVKGDTVDYRDLLRVTLSQGYQLSGERRDLLVLVDEGRPFTDTRLKAELFPDPRLRLQTDLRISPYSGSLTNASLGVDGVGTTGSRLGLSWHRAQNELDYLEGSFTLKELKPFTVSALGRYAFDKPGFLEKMYSVEYGHQCWSLNVTYRERPDNKELTFNFTLTGLGATGPLRAF